MSNSTIETKEVSQDNKRITGNVRWFSNKLNFGFIEVKDREKDVFVHFSAIKADGYRTLRAKEKVSFVLGKNNEGKEQATEVEVFEKDRDSSA